MVVRYWEFPIGDDLVVARPDVHGLFLLNSTARFVWNEAQRDVPVEDIAASLVHVYGIGFAQALQDVRDVLATTEIPHSPELVDNSGATHGAAAWQSPVGASPISAEHSWAARSSPENWHTVQLLYCCLNNRIFKIGLGSQDAFDEIAPRLEALLVPPAAPDYALDILETSEAFLLWRGDDCIAAEESAGEIRARLLQELVRLSEPGREWLALLHAGACAIGERCVLFPAASHSGKTTLAGVLMNSGFALLSDDFAGIERGTLRVPGMPFALAVREGSWPVISRHYPELDRQRPVTRLGERLKFLPVRQAAVKSAEPVAVVISTWHSGHPTSLEPLTTLEVLVALKESGFWVAHDESSIRTFLAWLQSIPAYRLAYGDVDDAAAQIRLIMEARHS